MMWYVTHDGEVVRMHHVGEQNSTLYDVDIFCLMLDRLTCFSYKGTPTPERPEEDGQETAFSGGKLPS